MVAVAVPALAQTITVEKYPTTATRALAFDSDDNAWAPVADAVIRLNPDTNILTTWNEANPGVFSSTPAQQIGMDSATGNVWVGSGANINRLEIDPVTEAADITTWPLASGATCGTNVAIDGDGNAWFGQNNSRIARLEPEPTNTITTWQVPAAKTVPPSTTCPEVIAAEGGDGSPVTVWVCEANLGKIGRLNPATNEITEWTIEGSAFSDCHSRADDGGIWFARSTPQVLRLSGNALTTWSCSVACTAVKWVDAKMADRVWLGEHRGSGACPSDYRCPDHRASFNPAIDPPVFTEYGTMNIGRLFVDGAGNVWGACDYSPTCWFSDDDMRRIPAP